MGTNYKQKVLFLVPLPPPVHGSSMMCDYIRKSELVKGELECDFVNLSTSHSIDEIGKKPLLKLWRFLMVYFVVIGKLIRHRYDVAYIANTCYGIGFLKDMPFIVLCKWFCRRVVLHQHNQGARMYVKRFGYRWLMPWVYRNVRVILLSWNLFEDMKGLITKEQVLICPNGIPSNDNANDNKPADGLKPETNVETPVNIFFLSNLLKAKGVLVLLDAVKVLKDEGLKFTFDMVGGETADYNRVTFQEEIVKRGLEGIVEYHGPKYGDEKERYWQKADVFILPTLRECFPLVICEAMQHGVACVATYEGAIPDIVDDGKTGYTFEMGKAAELSDCLRKLITDSDLRKQMGEAGYEKYKRELTIDAFEKRIVDCLKASIEG